MNFFTLALTASVVLFGSAYAQKEIVTCSRDGKPVGEPHIVEASWAFHSPQSSCRVNNADYCNTYEVACAGADCTTDLKPANRQEPDLPF